MSNSTQSKFPELLQLKLPRGTNAALDEFASGFHRSKSDIARLAILREIASVGLVTVLRVIPNATRRKATDPPRDRTNRSRTVSRVIP